MRYHLMVHTEENLSEGTVEGRLGDKVRVSEEGLRRMSCDASTVIVKQDSTGAVIDVGRKTRRISTKLRIALNESDGGCRFPGCTNRIVAAHHIEHWADGGETKLSNLASLCGYHHGFIHDGKAMVGSDLIFRRPDGTPITNDLSTMRMAARSVTPIMPVVTPLPNALLPKVALRPVSGESLDLGYALWVLRSQHPAAPML